MKEISGAEPRAACNAPAMGSANQDALPKQPRSRVQMWAIILPMIITGGVLGCLIAAAHTDMNVPIRYSGDSIYHLTVFKGVAEGNVPWRNARLAAPESGSDWRDYPVYQWVDFIAFRLLSFFTPNFIKAFNWYWILTVIATAGTAAYGFMRLRVTPMVAGCLAFLYAMQPYIFVRNITHFVLVCYLVPLLATVCIEVALGRWERIRPSGPRDIPTYAWIAFVLQGISFFYFSFFAGLLLLIAAFWGFCARRTLDAARHTAWLLVTLAFFTVVGASPTLVHWLHSGINPAAIERDAAQAEANGLRVRHMFAPVPEHPLKFMRDLANRAAILHPEVTEATGTRLGTLGVIGFTALILYSLISPSGWKLASDNGNVAACATLLLAASLWCIVGGFGSVFNTYISPAIRGYDRIIVFIVFFILTAYGSVATTLFGSKPWARAHPLMVAVGLVAATGLAFWDALWFVPQTPEMRQQAAAERQFVGQVEGVFGGNGVVFQLPYTTFPSGWGPGKMAPFDHLRPYIQSTSLRWSWGAPINTDRANWAAGISRLAPAAMLPELSDNGFRGIWIDTFGYENPEDPVRQLTAALGRQPLVSPDARYVFFDIRGFQAPVESLMAALPAPQTEALIHNSAACNVDLINNKSLAGARISVDGSVRLQIDGWLADTIRGVALPEVYVEFIAAGGRHYYIRASRYERPDVAAAFKKPELLRSGFMASGKLDQLPQGSYTARFLQLGSSDAEACPSVLTFDVH